jgi:glycosyltransferase involved in cell wall biosynthesis
VRRRRSRSPKPSTRPACEPELTIVGSKPPIPDEARRFVNVRGFVAEAESDSAIPDLLAGSHFLVLPTRAETYGLVLCEANAYGVPCLTTSVGGVPTVVRNGVNGTLFDVDAPVDAYVSEVIRLFDDLDSYRQRAYSAHEEYRRRLNWEWPAPAFASSSSVCRRERPRRGQPTARQGRREKS